MGQGQRGCAEATPVCFLKGNPRGRAADSVEVDLEARGGSIPRRFDVDYTRHGTLPLHKRRHGSVGDSHQLREQPKHRLSH